MRRKFHHCNKKEIKKNEICANGLTGSNGNQNRWFKYLHFWFIWSLGNANHSEIEIRMTSHSDYYFRHVFLLTIEMHNDFVFKIKVYVGSSLEKETKKKKKFTRIFELFLNYAIFCDSHSWLDLLMIFWPSFGFFFLLQNKKVTENMIKPSARSCYVTVINLLHFDCVC